jgi:hypothetical protein
MTILAYIGTYYAIAAAVPLTLANYLIVGWFSSDVDQFYLTSWKIFVGMAVVFNVLVSFHLTTSSVSFADEIIVPPRLRNAPT